MSRMSMPDYGPLPAGVTESQMMDRMLRPADDPVSIEHARRFKIDKERREKLNGAPSGINTPSYHNINMINAPSPINTARPIRYNPGPAIPYTQSSGQAAPR